MAIAAACTLSACTGDDAPGAESSEVIVSTTTKAATGGATTAEPLAPDDASLATTTEAPAFTTTSTTDPRAAADPDRDRWVQLDWSGLGPTLVTDTGVEVLGPEEDLFGTAALLRSPDGVSFTWRRIEAMEDWDLPMTAANGLTADVIPSEYGPVGESLDAVSLGRVVLRDPDGGVLREWPWATQQAPQIRVADFDGTRLLIARSAIEPALAPEEYALIDLTCASCTETFVGLPGGAALVGADAAEVSKALDLAPPNVCPTWSESERIEPHPDVPAWGVPEFESLADAVAMCDGAAFSRLTGIGFAAIVPDEAWTDLAELLLSAPLHQSDDIVRVELISPEGEVRRLEVREGPSSELSLPVLGPPRLRLQVDDALVVLSGEVTAEPDAVIDALVDALVGVDSQLLDLTTIEADSITPDGAVADLVADLAHGVLRDEAIAAAQLDVTRPVNSDIPDARIRVTAHGGADTEELRTMLWQLFGTFSQNSSVDVFPSELSDAHLGDVDQFVAFAQGDIGSDEVDFAHRVAIVVGDRVIRWLNPSELDDREAWKVELPFFGGRDGPFNALDMLVTDAELSLDVGPRRCLGITSAAPTELRSVAQATVTPTELPAGCGVSWFAVNVWAHDDGIVGVGLDLVEP